MLVKKLKKFGRECRRAEDPVLLTLAGYLDHVVTYLERSDDVKAREYGSALAGLDLSAVARACEALAVAEPPAEQEAGVPPPESSGGKEEKKAKKAKKKEAKRKAEEAEAAAVLPAPSEAERAAEPAAEDPSVKPKKKGKKNKKKGK